MNTIPVTVSRINAKETNPENPKAYKIINAERLGDNLFEGEYDFNDGKVGLAGYFTTTAEELINAINRLNNPTVDIVSY